MPPSSSQIPNTLYTPAARQPEFPCPYCARRCYSRAGLKNHLHAKHSSPRRETSADRSSSLPAGDHLSESFSQNSEDDEEQPMDVNFDVPLPPAFPNALHNDEYDYGHNFDFDMNLHDHHNDPSHSPSSESSLIIPSSPQRESGHQQSPVPVNDRFLKRVYHDKLNGELITPLFNLIFNKLCIISRSEM
jgi:hypothetical protein